MYHYYSYSISGDFPSGYDGGLLFDQIETDGTIGPLCAGIAGVGDVIKVRMTQSLTAGEKTILDSLVAAHTPVTPSENDGKGTLNNHVHYKQAKTESASNKTEWKQKIVITTGKIVGKVRLSWCYQWKYSATNSKICVRVTVDGNEIWKHEQEPKDSSDWHPVGSKMYETLAEGVHVIVLEYMPSQNGKTARLKNALIELKEFRED